VVLFGHLLLRLGGRAVLAAGGEKGRLLAGAGVVAAALDFDVLPMHEVFTDTPPDRCRLPGLLGRHERLISCFAAGDRRGRGRLAALCGAADAAFLPTRPPEGFAGHLLDLWGDLLAEGGLATAAAGTPWKVPAAWCEAAGSELRKIGAAADRPRVLIHPGAGGEAKCWPLENFLRLAGLLAGVVFVVGPVEADRWPAGRIERLRAAGPLLVCPKLELLAGAAAGAAAFVGNDSGVAHLAAAVGTPTVVLFGPTDPAHFAPVGRAVKVLRAPSLEEISAEQVRDALRQ